MSIMYHMDHLFVAPYRLIDKQICGTFVFTFDVSANNAAQPQQQQQISTGKSSTKR